VKRRELIALLAGTAAVGWPGAVWGQQAPSRIGFLASGAAKSVGTIMRLDALRQGLAENGLFETRNYVLEPRFAEGDYKRFPDYARELVQQNAKVIVVSTIAAAHAAQRASSIIPIVMGSINDPVGNGLVASLAQPGGNTTGLATLNEDLSPKLIEVVHDLLPHATALSVLFNPANPSGPAYFNSIRVAAAPLKIEVRPLEVKPDQLSSIVGALATQRSDALIVVSDAALIEVADVITAHALQHRLPTISSSPELTNFLGGLISYGVSSRENYRRAAYFIRKILDGTKPSDLPIEQPTRILLSINLKTARALGLTVPPTLLARADEVIE
jgi:putative tryptophan/tyrosine transport system substrate-binding protein